MGFKPGHKPENNNKQQKYSAWAFGRLVRKQYMQEVVDTALDLLRNGPPPVRAHMVEYFTERGLGKVADQMEFAGEAGGPMRITFEAVAVVKEQPVIELDEQTNILPIPKAASRVRK